MNAIIQTLNNCGNNFLNFAWPMLWQSSLLIAVVFAFDLTLARRVRASVRYALWMVVLVKLILPPALALPTGATWWLWHSKPASVVPIIKNYTVSYDNAAPEYIPAPSVPYVPPPPKLSGGAWAVISAGAMGVGLLLWLILRWSGVAAKVRHAPTSDTFADALNEARQLIRLRGRPRLKLVEDTQSPAVYGLFRPVILLPRALAEKLSAKQLRAVLLHEAIHLRRGDVWVNCAQTLLQIAYWWHPLLWLANARIRRVREEAVDDAVMLALHDNGDGADSYAPTLLEVAKFAFRRPLASLGLLGLIGILESRSALRQRVERLVDFHPPRRAGITFLSLCGIFAFSAVALPMGQGPSTTDSFSADTDSGEQTLTMKVDPQVFIRNLKKETKTTLEQDPNETLLVLMDGEGVDCVPPHGFAFNTKTGEITVQNTPEQLEIIRRVIEQLNRADGKCELPLVGTSFHRKKMMFEANYFWMTPDDLKNLTVDVSWYHKLNRNAEFWRVDAAQLGNVKRHIKQLGLHSLMQDRLETAQGISGVLHSGNSSNWIEFGCDPFAYDQSEITFQFRTTVVSVSPEDGKTNRCEISGRATVDENGGIVVNALDPNQSSTNLVVVISVKPMEEAPAAGNNPYQTRLQAILRQVEGKNGSPSPVIKNARNDPDENAPPIDVSYDSTQPNDASPNEEEFHKLEHEGHQFYDQGKFSKAEQDFTSAQALEPTNPATRYWLFEATKHNQIQTIHLDQFGPYDKAPLSEVVKDLNQKATNAGAFFNIHFSAGNNPAGRNTVVTIRKMKNVPLGDAFGAIVLGASQPTAYFIEDVGGVTFCTGPNRYFQMRGFEVGADASTNAFFTHLQEQTGLNNVNAALEQLFKKAGLDMSSPKTVFYNEHHGGWIYVYATREDLKTIEHIIQKLNSSPEPKNVSRDLSISTTSDFDKFLNDTLTGNGVFGSTTVADTNGLETKLFYVGTHDFLTNVLAQTGQGNPLEGFRELAANAGVDLSPPKNVSLLSYNMGILQVCASTNDMIAIARILADLHCPPPMIHIKARFVEVPPSLFAEAGIHNSFPAGITNGTIMTNPNFQVLLHEIEHQQGVEELAEPEVTTIVGRQTEMRATGWQEVVTNYTAVQNLDGNHPSVLCIYPQTSMIEVGPILDVMPLALADGYTLGLVTTALRIQFFGYASADGLPVTYATNAVTGDRTVLPISLPAFQVSEAHTQKNVWDGQTFVLFPDKLPQQSSVYAPDEKRKELITEHIRDAEKSYGDKTLVVFVTATLIDPAGNRLHSDDEIPFAQTSVPAQ